MTKISIEYLACAIAKLTKMSHKEKEIIYETIYKTQPNLLASVLVLHRMGRSNEEMEVLFEILLVSHLALLNSAVKLETVSEDLQERELNRYAKHVNDIDKLSPSDRDTALKDHIENHREKPLLAYTLHRMEEAGFTNKTDESSKHLTLCGVNLVNCIAAAKTI